MANQNEINTGVLKSASILLDNYKAANNPTNYFLFISAENADSKGKEQSYQIHGSGGVEDIASLIYTFMTMSPKYYESVRLALIHYIEVKKPENAVIVNKIIDAFKNQEN